MIEVNGGINPDLPDASYDLDGTTFKMTILEIYTEWLCDQQIFDPMPPEITEAKKVWKPLNTEATYKAHLDMLVQFFIGQVKDKPVDMLTFAAQVVADQQRHREWNVTTGLIRETKKSHNNLAISLMPEWLMRPFVYDLGFVALIGSTYVERDGTFTGEAHSINKGEAYRETSNGDSSMLDIHMGDTVGDSSLFAMAERPVLFNPSGTLYLAERNQHPTIIQSNKDLTTVINWDDATSRDTAEFFVAPYDAAAILSRVRYVR
jgi:phosphoserine phosphatase